ncbi:MAG: DUF1905 domain-containing protein [Bacteroidales bacterium]|nr:DUF1905 domain-containing protein [Bacteroidales bacterium]HOY38429.1 YdeI/OmpD-associated family protein [Bacteroidales bacterium]HQP03120.1 YdeI/OmpD-associated family protein [Bacteroidales bacterium]
MENKVYEFDATLHREGSQNIAFIEIPFNVEKEFGTKGRVKVDVLFDGYRYRGSIVTMGHPCHILGVNRTIRNAIQKNPGDTVHIVLKQDTEERMVEVPDYIKDALQTDQAIWEKFLRSCYSRRREYIAYIEEAKREETRFSRILKVIEALSKKKM